MLEEVSVDGGKVHLRTPVGEPCQWKDYKAVASEAAIVACYQQNKVGRVGQSTALGNSFKLPR